MSWLTTYAREVVVAATYCTVLIIMAIFAPAFFHGEFGGTFVRMAPMLLAGIGMTLVIVARQIDISIGAQFSICGVLAGLLAKAGHPAPSTALAVIASGAMMGACNGALVAWAGLPSIVVTLATWVVLTQSLRWARGGAAVHDLPPGFQWFGLSQRAGEGVVVIIALGVLVAFAWAMRNLAGFRAVFAVGSDAGAARLAGIRPRRVTFSTFVLLGSLVALAALTNAVRFPQVDTNAGNGLELAVIAAVVVGGTAITGGRGTLAGTLFGVALLTTIGPALVFLHLPAQWEQAIQGVIILTAVASDRFLGKVG